MTTPPPSVEQLAEELRELRGQVKQLRAAKRRRWVLAVLVLGASAAWAQLVTFQANKPAVAADVNGNFSMLKAWLEQKVGAAGDPNVRIQTGSTSNVSAASGIALFASANTGGSILEVRHDNLSQGIGLGFNTISAVGSNANVDLNVTSKGTGKVVITNFSAATEVGYEFSCGEASFLNSILGNPFCCRMNTKTGAVQCVNATNANGTTWGTVFDYPGLAAAPVGRYHLSCQGGTPGASYPFCCRMDANSGQVTCVPGTSYNFSTTGTPVFVPFP